MSQCIVAVYTDTGAREDWQPCIQIVTDIPPRYNLSSFEDYLNSQLNLSLERQGYSDDDLQQVYIYVTPIVKEDTVVGLDKQLSDFVLSEIFED